MKTTRHTAAGVLCTVVLTLLASGLSADAPQVTPPRAASLMPVSVAIDGPRAQEPGDSGPFRSIQPTVRVGRDYTLRAGDVAGEVRVVLGDVTLAGRVERDIVVVFGNLRAASTAVVDGNVAVVGGSATIDPGAKVHGDLVVVGGTLAAPADFAPGGSHVVIGTPAVGGAVRTLLPWLTRGLLWGRLIVPDLGWVWMVVLVALLVYLGLNTLFDGPVAASAAAIVEKPFTVFLVGLLVLVLTVPVVLILAASVVGIAVVPFLLAAMFVAVLLGKAGVARVVGASLVRQSSPESRLQSLRSFLLGSFVILLAYVVPVLGVVTWALTSVLATGAAAVMVRRGLRREHPRRWRAAAVPESAAAPAPSVADRATAYEAATPLDAAPAVAARVLNGAGDQSAAGLPPPSPGDAVLLPRATFLDRVAAFALDCLLVGITVALLDLSRQDGAFPLLLLAYHIAFWAWKGTTLGGIVVGLLVIRSQGTSVRFADALVRGLSSLFSLFALGIGCFWMLQDPERQMWHDKIAGTLVVKVPRNQLLA